MEKKVEPQFIKEYNELNESKRKKEIKIELNENRQKLITEYNESTDLKR